MSVGTQTGPIVVLLLNMGGPDSEAAVAPFLTNLFLDPEILPLPLPGFLRGFVARRIAAKRAVKVLPRYRLLGGKSPQGELTARQAQALQARLNADAHPPPTPKGGGAAARAGACSSRCATGTRSPRRRSRKLPRCTRRASSRSRSTPTTRARSAAAASAN